MKQLITLIFVLASFFFLVACSKTLEQSETPSKNSQTEASSSTSSTKPESFSDEDSGLTLSDMVVKITSLDHAATFQLYDTTAAKELYKQLPLELELTNFRDAQWMFYPPKKLGVTKMIQSEKETSLQISIEANGNTTVFELNDSLASKELYEQLPLTIVVEDYSSNEKIFYPPEKLDTTDTPLADAKLGTLAYYAPWGDVVMFYDSFGSAGGLYELGNSISGSEYIENMSDSIQIDKVE